MLREITEALTRGRLLLITARCTVHYEGRISSILPEGERMILVKQDRSVNIIQPQGVLPVNYMKEGSRVSLEEDETTHEPVLLIEHDRLREQMRIILHRILDVKSYTLHDPARIELLGTEKDMHEHIYQHPELISPDFKPFSREEQTRYGYIDILGHDGQGNLVVVECKRGQADYTAVVQLERYVKRLAEERGVSAEKIKGVLAAPSMSEDAKAYLREKGFTFRRVQPPERRVRMKRQQGLNAWLRKD